MTQSVSDAVQAVCDVIGKAQKEVLICSGRLFAGCYGDQRTIDCIEKAKREEVRFSVLTGPEMDAGSERVVELLKDNIYLAPREPIVHFTVSDGRHLRFETRDDGTEFENIQRFNDPVSGSYLRRKFMEALPQAQKYSDTDGQET